MINLNEQSVSRTNEQRMNITSQPPKLNKLFIFFMDNRVVEEYEEHNQASSEDNNIVQSVAKK